MELDKENEKKLKRGLSDLSPLFQTTVSSVPPPALPRSSHSGVQFITVCVPDHEGDAFLVNAYVASQIVRRSEVFASLISVAPGMNTLPSKSNHPFPALELLDPRISRIGISHQELWGITKNGPAEKDVPEGDFILFLEFEPAQLRSLARIALLLDRLILFVQPEAESLREAYRLTKTFWHLNREIEFFLLFQEASLSGPRQEFLFERFSLITSRFLGLSARWLGSLAFPEKNERSGKILNEEFQFNMEPLLTNEGLGRPLSPEKKRFWRYFHPILHRPFHHEPAPKHA